MGQTNSTTGSGYEVDYRRHGVVRSQREGDVLDAVCECHLFLMVGTIFDKWGTRTQITWSGRSMRSMRETLEE